MRFHFHFDRTVQAAAYLLKKSGGQKMEYIRLLKLLYIADREYLAEHGDMITRDRVCAMKFGPVLSCTLNLIRGRDSNSPRWYDFFKLHEKEIFLRNDPGEGELCKAITNRIDAVCERFEPMSWNDIIEITHGFPEWEKFYQENTSTTIPWEEILKAQGAENLIPIVDENIRLSRFNEKLFGHN